MVHYVRHRATWSIVPMLIIGDVEFVLDHLYETSEAFADLPHDFVVEERKSFVLDPGGMATVAHNAAEFELDGDKFWLRWEHVSKVLEILNWRNAEDLERFPGYVRFQQFYYHAVMPIALFERLKVKLAELAMKDEALGASLSMEESRERHEKAGVLIRMDIPREPSDPLYGITKPV